MEGMSPSDLAVGMDKRGENETRVERVGLPRLPSSVPRAAQQLYGLLVGGGI